MFSAIHVLGFVGSSAFAQVVWQNQFIEFASVPEVWAGKVRDVADFCDVANMPEMKKHLDTFIPFPIFGAPPLWKPSCTAVNVFPLQRTLSCLSYHKENKDSGFAVLVCS